MTQAIKKPTALWLRVSTSDQNLESQESALRKLAIDLDLEVVKVYGLKRSAWTGGQNDEFQQLLDDSRDGKFSNVLIWSLDRLDRQGVLSTLKKLEKLDEAGLTLVSHQESWLNQVSSVRGLLIPVIAWVAQWESERRSERVKSRKVALAAQGRWPGGKPPYGYANRDGALVVIEAEAKIVERIFTAYADRKLGQRRIEDELLRLSVKGRGGRRFNRSNVHRVLSDPTYLGEHPTGVTAPAIIDEALWTRAQARAKENRHLRPTRSRVLWPLQGMKCGVCGSRIGVDSGGGRRRMYYCRGRQRDSGYFMSTGKTCSVPRQPADELEQELLDKLRAAMDSPAAFIEAIAAEISRLELREQELAADIGPLVEEIDDLTRQLVEIDRARIKGRIPAAELDQSETEAERRLESVTARYESLGSNGKTELEGTRALLKGARDWRSVAENRANLQLPMNRFSLHPATAETEDLHSFRQAGGPLGDAGSGSSAQSLRNVLDQLDANAFLFPDRLDVRGRIRLTVPLEDSGRNHDERQVVQPPRGSG
jgi:site-specific DNA recombinase